MEIINVSDQIIEVNVTNDIVVIQAQTGAYPLPNNVYSVFGRVGNVVALEGDYTLDQLSGVTISSPTNGQVLKYNGTTWVNGTDNNSVTSVFGRTGVITAESGDYTTLKVTEDTNLYFTNQRARYAVSGDSNSGVVYSNTTGIIALDDIPNTSLLHDSMTINGKLTALGGTVTLTTTDVAEGTNLYYTQTRFDTAFAAKSTTDLAEGTNLYFTNARAQAAITGTSPISVTSGNVSISQASATTSGYLSATDWAAFDAKQGTVTLTTTGNSGASTLISGVLNVPNYTLAGLGGISLTSLSATTPLSYNSSTGAFSIQAASSTQNGYLTSANWTTFNNKQAALSGTGFVKSTAGVISYDTNTYLTTISGIAAGGELSGTYANPSLVNSAVIGKVLTGLNVTGGTIAATDSILTAFGKVQNQINGLIGGSIYQGTWNASTNSPSLTSSVGTKGYYYIVSVSGTTNLNGITDWQLGDWAIYDGTAWQKVDNTDAVVSVNGFTGAVSLTTSNITEGTNLYYTDIRARASNSAGTGISYNSTTGVITNSAPDQTVVLTAGTGITTSGTYPNFTITNSAPDQTVSLTGGGTTSISGTYPNFTISSADQYTGTVTSVGITESAAALTITGSPVTTSGNINIAFAGASTDYVAGDGSLVPFPTVVTQAQNLVTEVYNETGATLTKGTVVYINGGHGNLPTITKAIATGDATSAQTYGIVRADITNNNNGYVTVLGNLDNIDTQAYAAGTQLYLSSTTAGAYTSTKQYAPAHLVYVGIVVRSHPTQGVIEVRIQNGFEMDELHNVSAQSPNNNDLLQYKTSTGLWTTVAGTTSNISEGTNLYYTDARSRAAIALTTTGSSGASTYNNTTGALNIPTYTLAGLGGINLTSLSATSPLLYNNSTGVFSIQQASGSQAGYLSSADWTTFNNKQGAITLTTTGSSGSATFSGGTLNIPTYTISGLGGLPLTGGTLTGALNGTSATFSGNITNNINVGTTTQLTLNNTSTSATQNTHIGAFAGNTYISTNWYYNNGAAFDDNTKKSSSIVLNGDGTINLNTNNVANTNPSTALALASTGAATFSSSVTANSTSGVSGSFVSSTYFGSIDLQNTGGDVAGKWNVQANSGAQVGGSAGSCFGIYSYNASAYRFWINGSGNVGIGTTSPGTMLHVYKSSASSVIRADYNGTTTIDMTASSGGNAFISSNTNTIFETGSTFTERMRITSGGIALWGRTTNWSVVGESTGAAIYQTGAVYSVVDSDNAALFSRKTNDGQIVLFRKDTTTVGYISTNTYSLPSDLNFKKNINTLDLGLNLVSKLRPVSYNHKIDDDNSPLSTGFIAQELEQSLTELGVEKNEYYILQNNPNEDETQSNYWLDYTKMIPVLVKAIQELKAEIDLLKSK